MHAVPVSVPNPDPASGAVPARRQGTSGRVLIIQTAFLGDAVLSLGVVETLAHYQPDLELDWLVRAGHESLVTGHPHLSECLTWDKKTPLPGWPRALTRQGQLWHLAQRLSQRPYTDIILLGRFASTGWLAVTVARATRARLSGFDKNPLSWAFDRVRPHRIGGSEHEQDRNHALLAHLIPRDAPRIPARLYPGPALEQAVASLRARGPYVTMAPASVWATKRLPLDGWLRLMAAQPPDHHIYLIGGPADAPLTGELAARACQLPKLASRVHDVAGHWPLLGVAALQGTAHMNYSGDSAPLHMASAMAAPVTGIFCSTVPDFGFGPTGPGARILETPLPLSCRPCGLHGHRACPKGHFLCAKTIPLDERTLFPQGTGS